MEKASSGRETNTYVFDEPDANSSNANTVLLSTDVDRGQSLLSDILTRSESTYSSTTTISAELSFKEKAMQLTKELTEKYPLITMDNEVIGEPRLAGTRFGVSDVLSAFCIYDSIDEIIAEHGNRYSEKQLRDAVRFARDFLDSFYTTS